MALVVEHDGNPLTGQQLTAEPVQLAMSTIYRATALTVTADGQPVPVTWTCTAAPGGFRTTATVDLTEASGATTLTFAVTTRGTSVQVVPVTIRAAHPWVDVSHTGPRIPEAQMTQHTGGDLTVAGVLTGVLFTGPITVRAPDVRLVDCVIRTARNSGNKAVNAVRGGLVLDHCEIDGLSNVEMGIGGAQFTVDHCNIHHVNDGVRMASGVLIDSSWIHHLVRKGTLHPDCVQTTVGTGSTIRRSVLEARNPDTGDLCNAAVMIGGETGPTRDLTIEDNLLSGGNYTINVGRGDIDYPTIRMRRNVYAGGWRYGPFAGNPAVVPDGDVTADGQPIKLKRW